MLRFRHNYVSMRTSLTTAFALIGVFSILFFLLITQISVKDNIDMLQKEELLRMSKVITNDMYGMSQSLFITIKDYTVWDEAYRNAKLDNKQFFEDNFQNWLPQNEDIAFVLVLGPQKKYPFFLWLPL